jgi:exopolysaccharide biosynthesis protein
MRLLLALLLLLLLANTTLRAEWRLGASTLRRTDSPAITHWSKTVQQGRQRPVMVELVILDRAKTTLKVIDLPPDESVAEGLRKAGALAGVNGGYFHKDRTPLGLVIIDGQTTHQLERAKLLSGLVTVTPRGANLLRVGEYKPGKQIRQALQAGPYLVDNGRAVQGLNSTRLAERTVLLAGKQGVVALLITSHVTLADLGKLLATPALFPELKIERALNLDGGSSTALWVDGTPAPFSHREWKRVRNALAVMPK